VSGVCVVLATAPSMEKGAELAKTLVDESLIACANLVPGLRSIYRWKGELCDEAEVLVVMKTRAERFAAVEARIRSLHVYEVPEILQLNVDAGHQPYLDWVLGSVR
jgi:periplasmic divalent cation tolerance protein